MTAYFKYPYEIRRLIYTTNLIEGYHRQLRKVTKTKTAYPTDESLIKLKFEQFTLLPENKPSNNQHFGF
ncbi:hypothetical protein DK28_0214865 [Peptococcaceae bacterium SCADC1_2_3]|nr:hypothetical protein DK28_0214865 [Peptococcaceae bacterium SCADC1_2_3]KFI36395.1 hypothetical protein HY00_00515 [Peptococcaceae bacterium SCADC1_2_3]